MGKPNSGKMIKTDRSIHGICIAAIKRHTIGPFDFRWTRIYEEKRDFLDAYPNILPDLHEAEIPICSTIIDAGNWSILTTRRLLTNIAGEIMEGSVEKSRCRSFGNCNSRRVDRTLGRLRLPDHSTMYFHIEARRASVVMIYGVRTRIRMEMCSLPVELATTAVS